jgi:hypothetical protein
MGMILRLALFWRPLILHHAAKEILKNRLKPLLRKQRCTNTIKGQYLVKMEAGAICIMP